MRECPILSVLSQDSVDEALRIIKTKVPSTNEMQLKQDQSVCAIPGETLNTARLRRTLLLLPQTLTADPTVWWITLSTTVNRSVPNTPIAVLNPSWKELPRT